MAKGLRVRVSQKLKVARYLLLIARCSLVTVAITVAVAAKGRESFCLTAQRNSTSFSPRISELSDH